MLDRREAVLVCNALQDVLSFSRYQTLLKNFETPEAVLCQKEKDLLSVEGITKKTAYNLTHWQTLFDLKKEIQLIEKSGVDLLMHGTPDYPLNLYPLPDPPVLLYCKGKLLPEDKESLSIVGSRSATEYGKSWTFQFAEELALRGWTLVSGLAAGIDTEAHRGALRAGGRTLAVVGHGLAFPLYPPENEYLARKIIHQGAVLSELPMTHSSQPRNFPKRNRIVSGLSLGVFVSEAARKSGAFITVDLALEQGKPVFALPGPIDSPLSEGPNWLIQQGATLVRNVEDLTEELPHPNQTYYNEDSAQKEVQSVPVKQLTEEEAQILSFLSSRGKRLDSLLSESRLPFNTLSRKLLELEIKNLVKQLPGQYYVKS